jgi:hypothetical protein
MFKKFTAAFALACASMVLATSASAGVEFGANDDTGKYSENPGPFFAKMAAVGMKQNVMTVRWTPGSSAIPDQAFLDRAVPAAQAQGIKVLFAVYPYPPSAIEAGQASPDAFAAWLGTLASRYPSVTTYIVGNEPNLNTFWRPQGDGTGKILSAASFGPFLAAGYDALKPRGATVLGVGLSPRGDLAPDRAGKTAPVAWIKALGDWYAGSGRTTPLMDGFSFHPYPNPSDFSVPLSYTYGWPNASVQELPRIKQALWDAFRGTGQATTLAGLKLYLDEVGWQVDTSAASGYTDSENVKVTTEATQAQIYSDLVKFVACDPDVAQLNFFGFYDERSRLGWQSALHLADGTARASAASVAAAIAQAGGNCQGASRSWTPATGVIGGAAEFGNLTTAKSARQKAWAFNATAAEQASYKAGVFAAGTTAAQAGRELASVQAAKLTTSGQIKANFSPRVQFPSATLPEGSYVYAIRMSADMNQSRATTLVSSPFAVGSGKAAAKPAKANPTKAKPTKAKPAKAKPTTAKPAKTKPTKAKPAKKATKKTAKTARATKATKQAAPVKSTP